jgi:hypothetical protein
MTNSKLKDSVIKFWTVLLLDIFSGNTILAFKLEDGFGS